MMLVRATCEVIDGILTLCLALNEPVQAKKAEAPKASGPAQPDESLVQQVMELGFTRPQALLGLKNTVSEGCRAAPLF